MFGIKEKKVNGARSQEDIGSMKKTARLAGWAYLSVALFGMGAQAIRMFLLEPGHAEATVENIINNESLFLAAIMSDIIMLTAYLLLGVFAYLLFKNVNGRISLLMLSFVVVSSAVAGLNVLNQFAALQLLGNADYLAAIPHDLLIAQVMHYLDMYESGTYIAQIMGWGPWLFPLGYMGYRSGYFPKFLGIMLMLGSVGLTFEGFRFFLLPDQQIVSAPGIIIATMAELTTIGWLIFRGVRKKAFEYPIERNTSVLAA